MCVQSSIIFMIDFRKVSIISPGLIFVQKAFLLAYFREAYFRRDMLVIEGYFAFQNGLRLFNTITA